MANPSSRNIHLSGSVKRFIATLTKERKLDFQAALVHLATDPSPDGSHKVELNHFPYQPNTGLVGLGFRSFWVVYRVCQDGAIHIGNADNIPNVSL